MKVWLVYEHAQPPGLVSVHATKDGAEARASQSLSWEVIEEEVEEP